VDVECRIIKRAAADRLRIVRPEGEEERVLRAPDIAVNGADTAATFAIEANPLPDSAGGWPGSHCRKIPFATSGSG
jgi:hypothetical protein